MATLEEHQRAAQHAHAQQQRQQTFGQYVATTIGQHVAHRIGMRVANGFEYVAHSILGSCYDSYKWMCPTTAEQVRRMAIFTRRDLDGFIAAATKQGRRHVIVQPHRLSPQMRQLYVRDGYRVTDEKQGDESMVRIAWDRPPSPRAIPKKTKVEPPKPKLP